MITSEEIAILVRSTLIAACPNLTVSWQRHGYEKTKEVVIIPHTSGGEGSIRTNVVKVNIHVPDIFDTVNKCYEIDYGSLIPMKKSVIDALKRHVEGNIGTNWKVSSIDQPLKEPEYNEHFASINIESYTRERNN